MNLRKSYLKRKRSDEKSHSIAHIPHADEAVGEDGKFLGVVLLLAVELPLLQAQGYFTQLLHGEHGRCYG